MAPAPPPTAPPDAPPEEAGFGAELVAGLLAVAIAIGCLIPPIVHFLTGPLGPAIGGFIAGQRVRPGARAVLVIAVMTGVGLAVAVGGLVLVLGALTEPGSPMEERGAGMLDSLQQGSMPLLVAAVAGLYGALLGGLGAGLGAAFKARAAGLS